MQTNLAIDYSQLDDIDFSNAEIVNNAIASIEIPDNLAKGSTRYTNNDRIKAAAVFSVVGKIKKTSEICNIPQRTLQDWHNTDWWEDLLTNIRAINKDLVNVRTQNIINKTFDKMEQRLDNGDYATYDLVSKEIIYKPVSAKDCATIFGIMFDKQRINNSLATNITATTTHHLIDIKQQFEAMTSSKVVDGKRIE